VRPAYNYPFGQYVFTRPGVVLPSRVSPFHTASPNPIAYASRVTYDGQVLAWSGISQIIKELFEIKKTPTFCWHKKYRGLTYIILEIFFLCHICLYFNITEFLENVNH